ncbi:pyridoxamine 5'-phosphate oxidase family protein [bacterium]|nr:pyridoxamine 5'-phosphate oxidase family protein [candidate division CSSED10-310 bacterium]
MSNLKSKIQAIIGLNQPAVLSTISEDNRPMGRYMMVTADASMTLYCVTGASSRKVRDIRNNPHVHLTMGFKPEAMAPVIHVSGIANILDDPGSREAHWDEMLTHYFSGPDDPEYCILQIIPARIEYWEAFTPEIWEP